MAKKVIFTKDEFNTEMRGLLLWFLKTNAVVITIGAIGTFLTALVVGERTAILGALIGLGSVLGSQLVNYILYRQKQLGKRTD